MSVDIINRLRHWSEGPPRVWLREAGQAPVSYAQLWQDTGRYVAALADLGVAKGDRVLVQVEKSPEVLVIYLACLRLGAVFLPVNPGYTSAETAYFLADASPALVIVDHAGDMGGSHVRSLTGFVAHAVAMAVDFVDPPHAADDLAAILYTSGTTGRSKGVMLTRGNLASNSEALVGVWRFSDADVLLHALPVFHTHGLFVATNCVLCAGASMIFHRAFGAAAVLADLPAASVMMGVPTFYTRLLAEPALTVQAVAGVRLFISGSAPLSPTTFAAWEARTGQRILERYGMTETGMITSNPDAGERRAGTVGQALPGVSVRIADAVDGVGGIEVAGPNVFQGYWGKPEQTAAEFRADGYFVTGDLGSFDAEGYLSISGRAKDLVITGGLNVYPAEVEAALDRLPGVAASAVIGVPHPDFGEAVVACVVASGPVDPEALRVALRGGLAAFKVPKRIIVVDDLPRNAMGKVQKAELRKVYVGVFGG